jgi:hypothetical protein
MITLAMATMDPTPVNTGGGKEPSRDIVTGPELHSTENPCYRQMLPQQHLLLQKPSTMISPFSLPPPLFIMVKKISQNSTMEIAHYRFHHLIMIRCPLCLNSLSILSILEHQHHHYSSRSVKQILNLSSSLLLSLCNILPQQGV